MPGSDRHLRHHVADADSLECATERPLRIALVNVPWARCDAPSIQCGLLKAALVAFGHTVDVLSLNLELSRSLGPKVYEAIWSFPNERHLLLGDWLFTASRIRGEGGSGEDYLAQYGILLTRYDDHIKEIAGDGVASEVLLRMRNQVLPEWVREQGSLAAWSDYDIIGFTSTFAQNVAAVAVAEAIRAGTSRPVIIFGGSNCDGDMGKALMRRFSVIDYVVNGEGDLILPAFAAALSRGDDVARLPGVVSREDGVVVSNGDAPRVRQLDELAVPDYSDYFDSVNANMAELLGDRQPVLLLEGSRGCWWGEKHHCKFCGLNALSMAFRAKSPERVLDEMAELVGRYRVRFIETVDNIMDMKYCGSLCEGLRDRKWDVRIFYEVKANLSRAQLRLLQESGITMIQPGVESLSTHVLELMEKGSTMLTNVRLLKWCAYFDMNVGWNIITGFPGERNADYEEQAELIPALYHLKPPGGCGPMWLERFSPYFQGDPRIKNVRPKEAYSYVYGDDSKDLQELAYFFDYDADEIAEDGAVRKLTAAVDDWRARAAREPKPRLVYYRGSDWINILDTRFESGRQINLNAWHALVYEFCSDRAHRLDRICEYLFDSCGEAVAGDEEVRAFVERCVSERLMVRENDYYLSLAIPRNGNW
jgi:ribosomal peptide maturation radical SAM protein 1